MPHTSEVRNDSPGNTLLARWNRLRVVPGGAALFSFFLGAVVPYSGTIGARVRTFEPGFAQVALPDRRRVRNHLASIHAMALANFCELTSGLAVLSALPQDTRGILVGFSISYLKKARGLLVAESRVDPALLPESGDFSVAVEARDAAGDVVVRAQAAWRIGKSKSA